MRLPPSLLPELPALLVVAEECHFGRAAERLNVTQSRVSQVVRRMEDLLGYRLFIRRPHVRLTRAGELLAKAVRLALSELDVAVARAGDAAAGGGGTVRLAYVPVAMLTGLPRLLKRFREENPRIELALHSAYSASLWEGLEANQFDVIVSWETRVSPGIQSYRFAPDSLIAVLPEGDPAACKAELSIDFFRNRDFVALDEGIAPQLHQTVGSICRSAGFEPRVVQRANDWASMLALVASGLGASIVSSTIGELCFPGVSFVPLVEGLGAGSFWIAYRETSADPAVNLLIAGLIAGSTTDGS